MVSVKPQRRSVGKILKIGKKKKNLSKASQLGFGFKTEVILGTPRMRRTRALLEPRKRWGHKSGSLLLQSVKPARAVGAGYPQPRGHCAQQLSEKLPQTSPLLSAVY